MIPPGRAALSVLLAPAAALYGAAVRVRNAYFDHLPAARRVAVPVISVGNLTVGGTGKTPFAAWLVRELGGRGLRAAVVSRGYLGSAGRGPVVISRGDGPLVGPKTSGDEPFLLARSLPGVVVVVGSDRHAAAMMASACGADVIVLDDGFQHRRLARDLDIVLLDPFRPFGNGRLLPAGPLREPLSSLRRAHAVVVTRTPAGVRRPEIEAALREVGGRCPVWFARTQRAGFVDRDGGATDPPSRAVAFCGIGNPEAFLADLRDEGVEIPAAREFRDHHPYGASDWKELAALAERHAAPLVTTEKDLVRVPHDPAGPRVIALRIETVVQEREGLMALVAESLGGRIP